MCFRGVFGATIGEGMRMTSTEWGRESVVWVEFLRGDGRVELGVVRRIVWDK